MNLTPSQRRQLFGRSSLNNPSNPNNPHNPTLVHFNTDTEYAANETLRQLGASDRATVTLKRELFGTRYYDTFTLPGGYYEALRVTIGEGDGKNWWCVVYPQLCLSAATEQDVVPAMGSLSKDDAELLEDGELRFRFRCLELLENLLGYFRDTGNGIPASE